MILATVPGGFVAELTYGEKVDCYRNLVAAGGGTVIHHRQEYAISGVEACDTDTGRAAYPLPACTVLTLLGRTHFRLLRVGHAADVGDRPA